MRAVSLAGSTVLVTGGAGTIGSSLVDQLLDAGVARIRILDNMVRGRHANLARALSSGRVSLVEGDIRNAPLVREMCAGADVVFHLAAIRITQCAAEPRAALEVMADGTFNVVEAATDAEVGKLVFSSSASVYGLAENFPTKETHHPYANETLYGAAKLFNEGVLRSFHAMRGLDYVALRYFNVYGPRMDIHGAYTEVLVRWMERIEQGLPPVILGDGRQTMDFVFTDDVAHSNILAATAEVTDEVFNIASGIETSLSELAEALLSVMGRGDLAVEFAPARTVNAVSRHLADITAAQQQLGFRPRVPLHEGLCRLVEWWRLEQCPQTEAS